MLADRGYQEVVNFAFVEEAWEADFAANVAEADLIDLTTFVYNEETLLVVPLTIASNAVPGNKKLGVAVNWLECHQSCVPGDAVVEATLAIGEEDKPAAAAPVIARWQQRVPAAAPAFPVRAAWMAGTNAD